MYTRLRNLQERLRSSLWLVPTMFVFAAAVVAEGAIRLDGWLAGQSLKIPFVYPGDMEGARQVLSVLAGSVISLTTISFSVMMVVLTLASNQFGPRVLRNFLADRFYQIVLAVFVATFAYCLLVLGRLPGPSESAGVPVPRIAITLVLIEAFVCLATLLAFIHHVARSIQASQIVKRAHLESSRAIATLYPEELGRDHLNPGKEEDPVPASKPFATIAADRAGYIQALSVDEVMAFARKHDVVIELLAKPGRFISTGTALARIYGKPREFDDDLESTVRSWVLLGAERTGEQDAQYGVRQLMEIAIRSLSPGINDPVTAIACIDYLGENMISLARRTMPTRGRYDETGELRVIVRRDKFEDIVSGAFGNLRHYGQGHPETMARLASILGDLSPHLKREEDREWARTALGELENDASHLKAEADRERFLEQCAASGRKLVSETS